MSNTHEGRTAVVSGAGRGLGQAICKALAERGANVVGLDIGDLDETAALVAAAATRHERSNWLGVRGDAGRAEDVARAQCEVAAFFGHCDILVNNAGIYGYVPWEELDWDTWRRYHSSNIDSQFLMCKAFVPGMKARGWGRIVNVTSDSVQLPIPASVAYKTTKMAVIGFTRGLAADLASHGITVNAASPSMTRTPGVMERLGEERLQHIASRQLIKKVAEPRDFVGLLLFLTGEESYFVTGQTMFSDGGLAFV